MSALRALHLTTPAPVESGPLQSVVTSLPEPGSHAVRLRVQACGLCHTDLHLVEGDLPLRQSPIVPGHQVVATVESVGSQVTAVKVGERVGVPWLHTTCGMCEFCQRGQENLCDQARFTGWDVDGGYAEGMLAEAGALVPIPASFSDEQAAPLLCAGLIGYRSLRLAEVQPGDQVGLFGFGASAHLAIQVARHWDCTVSVFTRSLAHRQLAEDLGAAWIGDAGQSPPRPLDCAILFAPAGGLVPASLRHLRKGGTLAINAIHLSPIPEMDYNLLYGERTVRSVTNATHRDAQEFMTLASNIPVKTQVEVFPLPAANEALRRLKHSELRGAAVLVP